MMPGTSTNSPSSNSSSYWMAALVGAIAVVGIWTKQQKRNCKNDKSRRRKPSDGASDTISVKGR